MKCARCDGEGYFVLIMKHRSVGISTIVVPNGRTVICPDCKGTGKV